MTVVIRIHDETREELRKYKAEHGQTYDEAVGDLLERAGWFDE